MSGTRHFIPPLEFRLRGIIGRYRRITHSNLMLDAFRNHWPEYVMEAAALGMFMLSACAFTVLLEHPGSPIHQALVNEPLLRRMLMGLAMGLSAIVIICSPWGQRSGAHMNPAVTLTFLTLRKIAPWDAMFYIIFQFLGGLSGVWVAAVAIGPSLQDAAVNYAVTAPGPAGVGVAFLAELVISALLMTTVLNVSNHRRLSRYTPFFAGALVAMFITFEAPLSGMSMNPARTVASGWHAGEWVALWIYFTAPPLAMLLAATVYRRRHGIHNVFCAKFHHRNNHRCIFNCRYGDLHAE
jgi:aquaporin Z